MDELVAKLKKVALELGIDPKAAKEEELEKIRKASRLAAFEKEAEVLSFIKILLQKN